MEELIYNNLNNEIQKDIVNKLQVVYILVQTRKLLELKEQKRNYEVLNLFCNWSLHARLGWEPTRKFFEEKIEPCIDKDWEYETIKAKLKKENNFFDLSELKNELSKLLSDYGCITISSKKWRSFIRILLEVLEECPVEYESDKIKGLSIVDVETTPTFRIHLKFNLTNGKNIIKVKLKNLT